MTKTSADFRGVDIREVWDFRLSIAAPYLFNSGETWVIRIIDNNSPEGAPNILEEIDTGIPAYKLVKGKKVRDPHDKSAISECYARLYQIREKYSRENIEARKPVVALINACNRHLGDLNAAAMKAEAAGDYKTAHEKRGEASEFLTQANREIKAEAERMNKEIEGAA